MLIQINQQHISPQAGPAHAQALIDWLQSKGWTEVEYTAGPATWTFDNVRQMFDFENAFITGREQITGPAYKWRILFPCECWRDLHRPAPCPCGIVEEMITEDNLRL